MKYDRATIFACILAIAPRRAAYSVVSPKRACRIGAFGNRARLHVFYTGLRTPTVLWSSARRRTQSDPLALLVLRYETARTDARRRTSQI